MSISNFEDIDGFITPTKSYNFKVSNPRQELQDIATMEPDFTSGVVDSHIENIVINFEELMDTGIKATIQITDKTGNNTYLMDKNKAYSISISI